MNANVIDGVNVNGVNETVETKVVEKKAKAKKAKAKVAKKVTEKETEKLSFNALLNELNVSGLNTNAGLKRENIYNESVYTDCVNDKEKKSVRRKIRNLLDNFLGSILRTENNPALCKQNVKQFIIFYKNVYKINDFSLSSICSNSKDDVKKKNLLKMLELVKKYK